MHVAVIGSGYVGLVAGACLAETGNDVVCVDNDAEKIARLQRNEIPIYEPGLEPMVQRNQAEGRLTFTTDIASAVPAPQIGFTLALYLTVYALLLLAYVSVIKHMAEKSE